MNTRFRDTFKGKVVNKRLTINTGVDEFPRFVVEYLIDNYCTEENFQEDLQQVIRRLRENFVHGAEAEKIRHQIRESRNPRYFDLNLSPPRYGKDQTITHGLFPVCYDEDEQNAIIKKIIDHYREKSPQASTDVKQIAADCYFNLQMVSITCKNPAFAEEKEWRIVYRPMIWRRAAGLEILGGNDDISFRTSRSNLVPFFRMPFAEKRKFEPILEIVLGPKQNLTKELDVLSWFFEKNKANVGRLRKSKATYR